MAIISVFSALSAHKTGLRKSILTAGSLKSRVKAAVTPFLRPFVFLLLQTFNDLQARLRAFARHLRIA